jgi:hypothetical protein
MLAQLIVFLSILAIFALTSLLSRDAQPLPPRPTRARGPDNLRPSAVPGRAEPARLGPYERASDRIASTAPAARFSEPATAARQVTGRRIPTDDGIMIIESNAGTVRPGSATAVPTQPSPSARTQRGYTAKRATRGRSPLTAAGAKPADHTRPRALTSLVTKSLAETKNRPLQITPLTSLSVPMSTPLGQLLAAPAPEPPAPFPPPRAFTSASIRSMFADSGKLREIAMLSELLQPPRALRPFHRSR